MLAVILTSAVMRVVLTLAVKQKPPAEEAAEDVVLAGGGEGEGFSWRKTKLERYCSRRRGPWSWPIKKDLLP